MFDLRGRVISLWAIALVAFVAPSAQAQLNLSWDDCGAAGSATRMFACNTNTSPLVGINATYLVGSFISPGLSLLKWEEAFVTVQSGAPTLPNWWWFTDGAGTVIGCRDLWVLVPTIGDAQTTASCADFFGDNNALGSANYFYSGAGNLATLYVSGAVVPDRYGPVAAGQENFSFTVRIKNDLTTGPGNCAGCTEGVTLTFDQLLLHEQGGDFTLTRAAPGGRNFVDWNGGVTPIATRSWGQIKTLYR